MNSRDTRIRDMFYPQGGARGKAWRRTVAIDGEKTQEVSYSHTTEVSHWTHIQCVFNWIHYTQFLTKPSVTDSVDGLSNLLSPSQKSLLHPQMLLFPHTKPSTNSVFTTKKLNPDLETGPTSHVHCHCCVEAWAVPVGDSPAVSCLTPLSSRSHHGMAADTENQPSFSQVMHVLLFQMEKNRHK